MSTTRITTLNQILEGLSRIATAHGQINTFGKGDIHEFQTSGVTEYPCLWVDLESATRTRVLTSYNFAYYVLDLVKRGEGNEFEVLSDCHKIAEDVIAEIRHASWTWNVNRTVDITIENFTEKTDDGEAGVVFRIPIQIVMDDNTCQIPNDSTLTRF